ncbi:hypothetical protein [Couchioplanes caeruleus]|uniref:Uncharacterized protein n=2 Tax=Couchioplanes caeruleus TaxID=56438 RepID=A0A1K0GXU1_9ACTN|nr:hypothetical protein [Couchioplanes caeruleus]OJF16244.1 hypothetical protein BG844_00425 [Couchioplanes caeruleus subsp. caeruleus]ROP28797.1 hypothetical protein EDD30_1573 [Couchioplanes caeruleus]
MVRAGGLIVLAVLLTAGCAAPTTTHQHGRGMSTADALLLAGNAVLVVVVLGLLFRRPRVRARADGRWRLPAAVRASGDDANRESGDQEAESPPGDETLRR